MHKRKRGNYWETYAADYLLKDGYKILFRNWTCRWGEIDLVAEKNGILVFVEVKFKSSESFGSSWEAVNHWKLVNQVKAMKMFLISEMVGKAYLNGKGSWRFDVVGITKVAGKVELRHFEAVPLPGLG